MDGVLRARLERMIDDLDPRERRKLSQDASALQRDAKVFARERGRRSARPGEPHPDAPVREWMVLVLARRQSEAGTLSELIVAPRPGLVLSITRRQATVHSEDEVLTCPLATPLVDRQASALAVGDRVGLGQRSDGVWELREVLPRRSVLSRPDPADPAVERVIVANVERVLVLCSAATPPPRPGLWDRVLIAAARGGVDCGVALNKLDLVSGEERARVLALLDPYRELCRVFPLSAATGEGLPALRAWLSGSLGALVGHSGVGKSSLINALDPQAQALTGGVSEALGKGRHTTTRSTLYTLHDGTRLIDTPGVRAFGLSRLSPVELRGAFPEIAALAESCPWADCAHLEESGCAVRAAARDGRLSSARYEGYRRIAAAIQDPT